MAKYVGKSAAALTVFIAGMVLLWAALSGNGHRVLEDVQLKGPHTTTLVFHGDSIANVPTGHVQMQLDEQPANIARRAQRDAWALQRAYQKGHADGVADMRPKQANLETMARVLYGEAMAMSNMALVGETVLERVDSPKHPSTIPGVVHEPWAFTSVHKNAQSLDTLDWEDNKPMKWRRAKRAAYLTLTLPDSLHELKTGTRHFFSPRSMPRWKPRPGWAEDERPSYVVDDKFHFFRKINEG